MSPLVDIAVGKAIERNKTVEYFEIQTDCDYGALREDLQNRGVPLARALETNKTLKEIRLMG